uniref:Ionotropic receptor 25a.1 n=1 Tax=Meteorus pulchricornis TaxID=51522 RepID=A0A1S5VFT3_9HYME|nr:ionotropic receptor 25a.1 [Meteorus pulchricornis]
MAPFMMKDPETGEWSGYCIDLINEIRAILNFEYEIHEAPDGQFGAMAPDGTWNGMIKELQSKRADIGLGSLSVMAERENVVDFTVPYYDLVGITILMQKPKIPTSLFKFLTVLENEVWLCILGSYFFTSLLMWLFDRWSPYSYQNNKEKYIDSEEKRIFDLKECLWFCITSITPQGGGEAPKNLSGRLVAATWWLFGFIIIASYTANLAAFLTVSRLDTPVESLEDLSKQYKIQYAPNFPSEAYTYFERMAAIEERFYEIWKDMSLNDSLSDIERAKLAVWDYPVSDRYTKMFQAMKESHFPSSPEEALKRVRGELANYSASEFAFIGDATIIKYLEMTNCDLMVVGDEFSRKPYAIAVQQGSPLKDQLNNALLQLLNKRKLEHLKNKWWNNNPLKRVCKKEDDQSDGISIQNIGGVFIVILVGIILACGTLAFEYYWYRYRPIAMAQQTRQTEKFASREVKPIRFQLKPAKGAFNNAEFRSRF